MYVSAESRSCYRETRLKSDLFNKAAELFLSASSGDVYRQKFSLPDLNDNAYKYFRVPANHYTSGQIVFESGGGISVWEAHSGDGRIHSCLKLTTVQNQMLSFNGCP